MGAFLENSLKGRKPSLLVIPGGRKDRKRKRAGVAAPAAPSGRCPAPPKILSTPRARAEWKRLAPIAWADGRLTPATLQPFTAYCQTFGRWASVEAEISRLQTEAASEASAWTITKPSGITQAAPLMRLARELSLDLLKFSAELALTPVSQQRVRLHPQLPPSPADKYLGGFAK